MYVIGTDRLNLLYICSTLDVAAGRDIVNYVEFNIPLDMDFDTSDLFSTAPTILYSRNQAQDILNQIKELRPSLIKNSSPIMSLVEGDNLDVNNLKIFKLGISKEL